jgi:putative redox protein
MKVTLKRLDDAFHFEAKNEDGKTVHLDASEKIGGKNHGVRPMQMLLMAAAGCAAIDIINILKKQRQEIFDFDIEVEGERESPSVKGEAAVFTDINIHFKLKGKIDFEKAGRAAKLSMEKYCSASKTLRLAGAKINYTVSVNS